MCSDCRHLVNCSPRDGRLVPRADFSPRAADQARQLIRTRANAEIPAGTAQDVRIRRRQSITREVYVAMGVDIPPTAQLPGGDDRDAATDDVDAVTPPSPVLGGRLRIPDAISRQYEVPQKWIRVAVAVPVLELPLPCDAAEWTRRSEAHGMRLRQGRRDRLPNMAWRRLTASKTHGDAFARHPRRFGIQRAGMRFWLPCGRLRSSRRT